MKKPFEYLLRLYATLVGLLFGLFLGLLLFSTLFRILLDSLFDYGDSGPLWVSWVIILITAVISICFIWISNKWMSIYIERKKNKGIAE